MCFFGNKLTYDLAELRVISSRPSLAEWQNLTIISKAYLLNNSPRKPKDKVDRDKDLIKPSIKRDPDDSSSMLPTQERTE